MRGVPRWLAVLCVVAIGVVVCAFSLHRALASGSLRAAACLAGRVPKAATSSASRGFAPLVRSRYATELDASDTIGDGTPDFLRLHDSGRPACLSAAGLRCWPRRSITADKLPAEIDDCAALLALHLSRSPAPARRRLGAARWRCRCASLRRGDIRSINIPTRRWRRDVSGARMEALPSAI